MENFEEMEMPTPCIHCGELFDLTDGYESQKWHPDTTFCVGCYELEKGDIAMNEEIEDLKANLIEAEENVKKYRKRLKVLDISLELSADSEKVVKSNLNDEQFEKFIKEVEKLSGDEDMKVNSHLLKNLDTNYYSEFLELMRRGGNIYSCMYFLSEIKSISVESKIPIKKIIAIAPKLNLLHALLTDFKKKKTCLTDKAEKWDKLDEKLSKFYSEDEEEQGHLLDIGLAAAKAFGYL